MGIINNFLKKIGLANEQQDLSDSTVNDVIGEFKRQKEEFNKSLEIQPSHPISAEEVIYENQTIEDKQGCIKVFSYKDSKTGQIYYEMVAVFDGEEISIAIVKEIPNKITLENISNQMLIIVNSAREFYKNGEKNDVIQAELKEKMKVLSTRYNIDFSGIVMRMVETIGYSYSEESFIDYSVIEKNLHRTIDMSKLKPEERLKYGRILDERVRFLKSIRTPDDAYENREGLENFMRNKEKIGPMSVIVSANLENLQNNGEPLDLSTVIVFSKIMESYSKEDGIFNEDRMLYSSYLKLEENRIIRKLQQDISSYIDSLEDIPENSPIKHLGKELIDYLETTKTSTEVGAKDNITSYMIETIQGRGIENYIKNTAEQDSKLIEFLTNNSIEDADEAIKYIKAKIACYGQVVNVHEKEEKSEETLLLRDYIEKTEYKDFDITELKNFLYQVVQIEIYYIEKNFDDFLLEFKRYVEQGGIR